MCARESRRNLKRPAVAAWIYLTVTYFWGGVGGGLSRSPWIRTWNPPISVTIFSKNQVVFGSEWICLRSLP